MNGRLGHAIQAMSIWFGSWTLAGLVALGAPAARGDSTVKAVDPARESTTPSGSAKWPSRTSRPGMGAEPDRAWWGMAAMTAALAAGGGIYSVYRRLLPAKGAGTMQVVGRMSLSPRHSVYVLRVGRRTLLVGTGPQGAPSLITELDEEPRADSESREGSGQ